MSDQALHEELRALRDLLESPGWKQYIAVYVEQQKEVRSNDVMLNPCKTLDATIEQEYQKGEYQGIALFGKFPELRITAIEVELGIKEKEDGRASEEGGNASGDTPGSTPDSPDAP